MARLALKPRFVEIEHLLNPGLESWSGSSPDSWQISGGGNGTVNKDTAEIFKGLSSARIDKSLSGGIYLFQNPRQSIAPGMYYRLQFARRTSQTGPQAQALSRFVNVTKGQSLLTTGLWAANTTSSWPGASSVSWRSSHLWIQIPASFSLSDLYDSRCGMFGTNAASSGWIDDCSILGPYARPVHMVGIDGVTTLSRMPRAIAVVLTDPNGVSYDITRRVSLDGLGSITEGAEEQILQLTHGDITLALDDRDGMIEGLLEDADAADRWEVVILQETGRARGLKWDRLFAGVLDLPWSVSHDRVTHETTVQVFSYTKALENVTATTVSRTVTGQTLTIAAGSKSATASSTANLMRGDKITARSGSASEEFTVDQVSSGTAFTVKDAAVNTFTTADFSLDTYFYREKTATFLANALCDAAPIGGRSLRLSADLAPFPLSQPIAMHGVGLSKKPLSLVVKTTASVPSLVASFAAADETKRKQTLGPTSAWTDGATTNNYQADWQPYLASEPATIYDRAQGDGFALSQDSQVQNVSGAATHWVAECVCYTAGTGFAVGDRIELQTSSGAHSPPNGTNDTFVSLYKNGSLVSNLTVINGAVIGTIYGWIEWDSFSNLPWVSYQYVPQGQTEPTIRAFGYVTGGSTFVSVSSTKSGQLRYARNLGANGTLVFFDSPVSLATGPSSTGTVYFYGSGSFTGTFGLYNTIAITKTTPLLWTFRTWSTFFAFLHRKLDGTYISIWRSSDLVKLAEYRISSLREASGFLTPFRLPDGRVVAMGYAGGEWFLLSRRLDGVIPYADFAGLSCSGALKEIAVASIACMDADRYNTIRILQRPSFLSAAASQTLPDPLEQTSLQIWEFFRTAVKVSGTDQEGTGFTEIQGVDGGSAKTLEISSALITTPAVALTVASFYFAFMNQKLRQENVRIDAPDEPIRNLDVVFFDGASWLVTQVDTNAREREQRLRLFEVL